LRIQGLPPGGCVSAGPVRVCRPPVDGVVFVGTASEAASEGLAPGMLRLLLHVPPLQAPRLGELSRAVDAVASGAPVYSPDPGRLYTVVASALEASGYPPPLAAVEASRVGVAPCTLVQRHVAEAYYYARVRGLLGRLASLGEEVVEYTAVLSALLGRGWGEVVEAARALASMTNYMVHGLRLSSGRVGVYISAPRGVAGSRVDSRRVAEACEAVRRSGGVYGFVVEACRAWPPFSVSEA